MVLNIDASEQSFELETIPDAVLARTLGGKGLATHLLLLHNATAVDPMSPENHLIFTTGPVTGTPVWGSCRYGAYTKSPQTGYYAESYAGGTVAEYMVRTGFDAVIFRGVCEKPTWIEISPEAVQFHPAGQLWGLDTYATEEHVREWIKSNRSEVSGCSIVVIGPAAENGVYFSVIENDRWRSAGRTGVGAVMGSKRIKAIAFWGSKTKELADPFFVKEFSRRLIERGKHDPGVKAYKSMGTPMMVDIMSRAGRFPSRYWQKGTTERREQINAPALHQHCDVTPHACLRCFIACGRLSTVKEGRHKGLKIEGPEYETIYAFGGLCDVDSVEEIAYLNDICDRLGMDTISAGNLVALTIEAVRQGKIDYPIGYGRVDEMAALLKDIAYRRGIGYNLAYGIKSAAETLGMTDQAIHVKDMEPSGFDPQVLKGMGLAYGTSDQGACKLGTTPSKPDHAKMIDLDRIAGKAVMLTEWEDRLTIFDSLILCRFYRDLYLWDDLAAMIKGITGLELGKNDMRSIASGITDNTRRFNVREGLTSKEDRLPKRFCSEVLPGTGEIIS
jgi:aldehyde:ferredoxin oxidoreductase